MIRNWYSMAGVAVLVVGTILFFQFSKTPIAERVSLSANEPQIQSETTVKINGINFRAELATTSEQKTAGLSYREEMNPGQGMLFVFDPPEIVSFWMYEMKFPIDIIWIKNNIIIGIERNVKAPAPNTNPNDLARYPSGNEIDYVLEINAGEGDSFNINNDVEIITTIIN